MHTHRLVIKSTFDSLFLAKPNWFGKKKKEQNKNQVYTWPSGVSPKNQPITQIWGGNSLILSTCTKTWGKKQKQKRSITHKMLYWIA